MVKWPYLRLRTTHTHFLPYQKSGGRLCVGVVSIQPGNLPRPPQKVNFLRFSKFSGILRIFRDSQNFREISARILFNSLLRELYCQPLLCTSRGGKIETARFVFGNLPFVGTAVLSDFRMHFTTGL